jgi:hypothetical protein
MADLFVMCPDCGMSVKLAQGDQHISYDKGKCRHRQSPIGCPTFGPLLNAMQKVARQPPKT